MNRLIAVALVVVAAALPLCGGTPAAFEACRPVFEAMGKTIIHCGPVGAGQTTKLVNQIVGALNLEAICEGLAFARRSSHWSPCARSRRWPGCRRTAPK